MQGVVKGYHQRANVQSGATQVGPFTHQTMCEGREGGMGLGHRDCCKMLRTAPSDLECTFFTLPARLGGLGISIPSRNADHELRSSLLVTSTLCNHILSHDEGYSYEIIAKQLESKALVRQENSAKCSTDANEIGEHLPVSLRRAIDLAKEKGSSTWLTVLEH